MSRAVSFTETGNEVIGIDSEMGKINLVKDKAAHAICMDSTNELAYNALPLRDTDLVVVVIGENEGAAIIKTAIVKKQSDVKIISRALSPTRDTVLIAMGVENLVHPELDSANRLTKQINFKTTSENYQLDNNHTISEVHAKADFVGKSSKELDEIDKYHLQLVTILRKKGRANLIGKKSVNKESVGTVYPNMVTEKDGILVVFGTNKDINACCDC